MDRLNLQHYLWKDQIGYLLHPSIPLSEIENPKIADVGTGTGYVQRELNRSNQSCQLLKSYMYHTLPAFPFL